MSWALVAGSGSLRWAKWIDRDAALAHLRVIRWAVTAADTANLMGPPPSDLSLPLAELEAWEADRLARQTARCVLLAESLRGFALACDLSVCALDPYAAARLACDAGEADYPGLYENFGVWRREVFGFLREANADVASASDVLLDLYPRVDFMASADSRDGLVRSLADAPETPHASDRREYKTRAAGRWSPWDGMIVRTWVPGALAASGRVECSVLLPLSWSWLLLRQVGQLVVSRGLDQSCGRTAIWIAQRNIRLSKQLGGTGLPATVLDAAAAADVAALGNGGLPGPVSQLMGIVSGVIGAINPVAGIVSACIVGLVELAYRVIPPATATAYDVWGRRQPFLEAMDLTGKIADRVAPTHEIPAPLMRIAPDPVPLVGAFIGGVPSPKPKSGGLGKVAALFLLARLLGGS